MQVWVAAAGIGICIAGDTEGWNKRSGYPPGL